MPETTIFESNIFTDADEIRTEFADELAEYYEKPVEKLSDDEVHRYYAYYEELNWRDETSALGGFLFGSRLLARGSMDGYEIADGFDELLHSGIFKDCEGIRIWDDNGALFMRGVHHDGQVNIEIRTLTNEGEALLEDWYTADRDFELSRLWDDPTLTQKPYYAEKAFGIPAENPQQKEPEKGEAMKDSRYTESTDPAIAPDFTKGYDLPEGWRWRCYDDGSGCLYAPDGQSFFAYDLASMEMQDEQGFYTGILSGDSIRERLERIILPDHEDRNAFEAEHPDWFRAYGLDAHRQYMIPDGVTRVALTPEMSMDAGEFEELLRKAHAAENAHFSDGVTSIYEFSRRLAAAYPGALEFEGESFSAVSMERIAAHGSQGCSEPYSLSSEKRDMHEWNSAMQSGTRAVERCPADDIQL